MPNDISIKRVQTLPTVRAGNNIGARIETFLPPASAQPTKVTEQAGGGGQVPLRHYWYSDGVTETVVTYHLDRAGGAQAARPSSVSVKDQTKDLILWSLDESGRVDWQQASEGSGRGSWFENVMDTDHNGAADVLVQGYLGMAANRFEKSAQGASATSTATPAPVPTPAAPARSSSRGAALSNLRPEQLAFLNRQDVVGPLSAAQRRVLFERATYEADRRSPEVEFYEGGRQGGIPMNSDQKRAAIAAGAQTNRQVLDHVFYGAFLPLDLERRWNTVFP